MLGLQQEAEELKTALFLEKLVHLSVHTEARERARFPGAVSTCIWEHKDMSSPLLLLKRGFKVLCCRQLSIIHSLTVFW